MLVSGGLDDFPRVPTSTRCSGLRLGAVIELPFAAAPVVEAGCCCRDWLVVVGAIPAARLPGAMPLGRQSLLARR